MFLKKTRQTARFLVVSKTPEGLAYAPNSAVAPILPDLNKVFRILLRFDPRRENCHPDDNDLVLSCDPTLYDALNEGSFIQGTWERNRLLSFEPCQ